MYDISHALHVSQLSHGIGKQLYLNEKDLTLLYAAGLFHDIGKMIMPVGILEKPALLSEDEYVIIQWHTTLGHKILSQMPDEIHILAAQAALYHHERFNGSGYLGLQGDDIPFAARIIAVADVYDALITDRPYRPKWSKADALTYINNNAGLLFDDVIVEAFMNSIIIPS